MGMLFWREKRCLSKASYFFPEEKCPHLLQPPSLNNPVVPLIIQNQVYRRPIIASCNVQVDRHLELQLQRVRARWHSHHIHPLNPRLKLLDALTDGSANLDTQVMSAQGGVVEIQQAKIRCAAAVARMGVQQSHQVALDGLHHMGELSHALPRRSGSLFK